MQTINIKGKEYVQVNEKLKYFRKNYPNYSLTSEVVEKTDKTILVLATIKDENDKARATGLAEEVQGSTFINKGSHVENCETSAWGRALSNFGIGIDTSVASYEEVKNAMINKEAKVKKPFAEDMLMGMIDSIGNDKYSFEYIDENYDLPNDVKEKLKAVKEITQ